MAISIEKMVGQNSPVALFYHQQLIYNYKMLLANMLWIN